MAVYIYLYYVRIDEYTGKGYLIHNPVSLGCQCLNRRGNSMGEISVFGEG